MTVLTKWNIGDVMFGPRQVVASQEDVVEAAIRWYDRVVSLNKTAKRKVVNGG